MPLDQGLLAVALDPSTAAWLSKVMVEKQWLKRCAHPSHPASRPYSYASSPFVCPYSGQISSAVGRVPLRVARLRDEERGAFWHNVRAAQRVPTACTQGYPGLLQHAVIARTLTHTHTLPHMHPRARAPTRARQPAACIRRGRASSKAGSGGEAKTTRASTSSAGLRNILVQMWTIQRDVRVTRRTPSGS